MEHGQEAAYTAPKAIRRRAAPPPRRGNLALACRGCSYLERGEEVPRAGCPDRRSKPVGGVRRGPTSASEQDWYSLLIVRL